jgi:RNA polymerase sigma factor (sigma-70 family)
LSAHDLLTKEDEESLARAVQAGCAEALDQLIRSNQRFVLRIATDYRELGLPLEDLIAEGNLGLIEAARRYDADDDARFATYAVWWVRKSILEAISRDRDEGRLSDHLADGNRPDPEADLLRHENDGLIEQAMVDVTDQQRQVLSMRFGLKDGPAITLKESGDRFGISRERVRQIENQAKVRLRRLFICERYPKSPFVPRRPRAL